jgi:lipopolysaccharide/colanic/teichoic acid biosynthesis glycosyltransferase
MALQPATLIAILVGSIAGTIVGALPGLSSTLGVALLIPFTFGLPAHVAFGLLGGMYCSSIYGGSITAILIKAYDKGPVFYKQARVTKDGKVFDIIKFRSMIPNAEADGKSRPAVSDDDRITPVGKVIRAIRFDEMPQIFNILKGDMSIVGPRPERTEHVEKYTKEFPEFAYRHKVKAGLTGYAQVYGKYNTTSYDKLKLDLFYIENDSLRTYIRLIFMTIKVLFMKESTEGFDKQDDGAAGGAPQS